MTIAGLSLVEFACIVVGGVGAYCLMQHPGVGRRPGMFWTGAVLSALALAGLTTLLLTAADSLRSSPTDSIAEWSLLAMAIVGCMGTATVLVVVRRFEAAQVISLTASGLIALVLVFTSTIYAAAVAFIASIGLATGWMTFLEQTNTCNRRESAEEANRPAGENSEPLLACLAGVLLATSLIAAVSTTLTPYREDGHREQVFPRLAPKANRQENTAAKPQSRAENQLAAQHEFTRALYTHHAVSTIAVGLVLMLAVVGCGILFDQTGNSIP